MRSMPLSQRPSWSLLLLLLRECQQPLAPRAKSHTIATAYLKDAQIGIDCQCLLFHLLHIVVDVWQQIELIDEHNLRTSEHLRILGGFVVALGSADQNDPH